MKDSDTVAMPEPSLSGQYLQVLNPLYMRLLLLCRGLAAPDCATACVLSAGPSAAVSMSTALHAAGSTTRWYHLELESPCALTADAARLQSDSLSPTAAAALPAASVPANLTHRRLALAELNTLPDLPVFDYIALPGIWSHISAPERQELLRFLHDRLAVGGVVYLSCHAEPGQTLTEPLRHLMRGYRRSSGNRAGGREALRFAQEILALDPVYVRTNPHLAQRLEGLAHWPEAVLQEDFLAPCRQAFHFSELCALLNEAKLSFAAPALLDEQLDAALFSPEQRALLAESSDPVFRETVRDFLRNRCYRQDYWVRGARHLSISEQEDALRSLYCVLPGHRALGEPALAAQLDLPESLYGPMLELLADHRPHRVDALLQHACTSGLTLQELKTCLLRLAACGLLAPAQEVSPLAAQKLNTWIVEQACGPAPRPCLACARTGGGLPVAHRQQLFLRAWLARPDSTAEAWARAACAVLTGKADTDAAPDSARQALLAALQREALAFAQTDLPRLRALEMVADGPVSAS